jgi:hypothetical protein
MCKKENYQNIYTNTNIKREREGQIQEITAIKLISKDQITTVISAKTARADNYR